MREGETGKLVVRVIVFTSAAEGFARDVTINVHVSHSAHKHSHVHTALCVEGAHLVVYCVRPHHDSIGACVYVYMLV